MGIGLLTFQFHVKGKIVCGTQTFSQSWKLGSDNKPFFIKNFL